MSDGSFDGWSAGDTYLVYPNGEPSWRFLDLRAGVVAAEKIRLLREQGLFTDALDALAKRFDVKAVNDGTANFRTLRQDTLALVNQ